MCEKITNFHIFVSKFVSIWGEIEKSNGHNIRENKLEEYFENIMEMIDFCDTRQYICIDLKSFFASVECVERGLDPFTTRLVVADSERSNTTICLAVTPAMKSLGVKSRCRLYEIPEGIDYIKATPRMKKYIEYSAEVYGVYLKYCSKDDIHVY